MQARNAIKAGFAERDITPVGFEKKIWSESKAFTGVLDPLLARVILLEGGGPPAAILYADVAAFHGGFVKRVARRVRQVLDISLDRIFCFTPENHSAPENLLEIDEAYLQRVEDAFLECLMEARQETVPVEIGLGKTTVENVAANRRWEMKDGSVRNGFQYQFPQFTRIYSWIFDHELDVPLPPEEEIAGPGPIDPEIRLLAIREIDGPIRSLLVNYSCHVSAAIKSPNYSRDFVGHLEDYLEEKTGSPIPVLFLRANGGNINANDHISERRDDKDAREIGIRLGAAVLPALQQLSYEPLDRYGCRSIPVSLETRKEFRIDYRNQWEGGLRRSLEQLEGVEGDEEEKLILKSKLKKAMEYKEWINHYMQKAEEGYTDPFPETGAHEAAVLLFRLNEAVLVGYPGEMFVEFGLGLKRESPMSWVFPTDDVNNYKAYIGTPESYGQGGYETGMNQWNVVAPDSGERLYRAALKGLQELS